MKDRGFTSKDEEMWSRSVDGDDRFRDEDDVDRDVDFTSKDDGRSQSRTWFHANDGDHNGDPLDDPEKWERLSQVNNGQLHDSEYPSRRNGSETRRDIDVVATQLDVTEYQKKRCKHIIETVGDLREKWSSDRMVVVFAMMTLIVNEDDRHIQRENVYGEMIEEIGTSRSAIHSLREKLRVHL